MTPTTPRTQKTVGIEATTALLRVVVLEKQTITRQYEILLESAAPLFERLADAINELKRSEGADVFGVAVSGLVSQAENRVVLSTQLPKMTVSDVAAEIAQATGTSVILENDANAAAFGEFVFGAGRGSRNMFFATIGAGIGGAIILNGKLWRGANGFAGEFGHISINEDGTKLEQVASANNIVRRTQERLIQDSTSSLASRKLEQAATVADIVEAARNGDDFAQLMLERTGTYIGTAIASVINLLNVERVVLGGEVMEAGGVILQSIKRRARERSFLPSFEAAQITGTELGANSAAVGAALLATHDA